MPYKDGRYWLTYNGEIYNHVELRAELESLGYGFMSGTDSEIIPAAYDAWGQECLHRFNGMWAFALFDTQEKTLFLARDRFGIKPLYYWTTPDSAFFFGSEIKQFTVLPGWDARLNHQRAYDFLVWAMSDHTDETFFEGVYQIAPGHCLTLDLTNPPTFDNGRAPVEQWYVLTPQNNTLSFEQAAAHFKTLLEDLVRLRLRADVPVGSCLSGGLDSSSIVCLMSALLEESDARHLQKLFPPVRMSQAWMSANGSIRSQPVPVWSLISPIRIFHIYSRSASRSHGIWTSRSAPPAFMRNGMSSH